MTHRPFLSISRWCYSVGINIYHLDMSFWNDFSPRKTSSDRYVNDSCHHRRRYSHCQTSIYLWWPCIRWKHPGRNLLFVAICHFNCWNIHFPAKSWKWSALYHYKLLLLHNWFCLTRNHHLVNYWIPPHLHGKSSALFGVRTSDWATLIHPDFYFRLNYRLCCGWV